VPNDKISYNVVQYGKFCIPQLLPSSFTATVSQYDEYIQLHECKIISNMHFPMVVLV